MVRTDEECLQLRNRLRKFRGYAAAFWTLKNKDSEIVPFHLRRCQVALDNEYERQMDERGFVRMNVLKLRQGGVTTWSMGRGMHFAMTRSATGLTLAHDDKLPPVWLNRSKGWVEQTPEALRPHVKLTNRNEIYFDKLESRYYVGSAGGQFPGMGDTITYLHLSELGSWDKSPLLIDPDEVLYDLKPALPTGDSIKGTVEIRESTGKMVSDWWNKAWIRGKDPKDEFVNLFLPWFFQEEYRRDDLASDILSLNDYEQWLVRQAKSVHGIDIDHAQLAFRRNGIRQDPYYGNIDEWACRYPATEEEAFVAPGETVYTRAHVQAALKTVRPPIEKKNILGEGAPSQAKFDDNEHGEMSIWEAPDPRYHYLLAADCMWGKKKENDKDVLYVECLETARICAKVKGQYPLNYWGWKIAAVGHLYNDCPVAPETNGQEAMSAGSVIAVLLGNVGTWRYPNIWIRNEDMKFKDHAPKDYGWWTTHPNKNEMIAFSMNGCLDGSFDWCDQDAVTQMGTIIRREDNSVGAPEGSHDDDWMARLMTGYIAHRQRSRTVLYAEPKAPVYHLRTPAERVKDILEGNDVWDDE